MEGHKADLAVCLNCGGVRRTPLGGLLVGAGPDGAGACRCGHAVKEEEESAAQWRAERTLRRAGMTAAQLSAWRFGTFQVTACVGDAGAKAQMCQIVEDLKRYAMRPVGWRVLQGWVGSGKTHLAYAVAGHRVRLGRSVLVSNAPDLLDMLRQGFADESYDRRIRRAKEVELLVLDDLGAENGTPFAMEKLYQIIDARYRDKRPLLVTTNRNLSRSNSAGQAQESESAGLPQRILSRLLDVDLAVVHTLPVLDYRRRSR